MRYKIKSELLTSILILILAFFSESQATTGILISNLPDSIKAIDNAAELEPFLNGDFEIDRIWGVVRLGQISSAADVSRLIEMYDNEPLRGPAGIHPPAQGVKYFSLLALGNIGGPEAEDAIVHISDQLNKTPKSQDSLLTLSGLCIALGHISTENSTERLRNIYENSKIEYHIRYLALSGIYRFELKNTANYTPADSVDYLFLKISNNFSKNMTNMEDFIITNAIGYTLYILASTVIIEELDNKINEVSDNDDLKKFLETAKEGMLIKLNY